VSDNLLYYGDNLDVLRRHVKDDPGAPGLVYLDPPFKSNRDYNVLFAERDVGVPASAGDCRPGPAVRSRRG
jgi:site-specific DNA-methyltransferase (adenine-specific)